jgi:hypothetical protein
MGIFKFLRRKHEPFSFVPDNAIGMSSGKDPIIERIEAMERSLKEHVSLETAKVSTQMAQTLSMELKHIVDRLETIPADTRKEIDISLSQLSRARTPFAVKTLTEEVSRKVTGAISDVIDSALLKTIQEKGKVSSTDMMKLVAERGICSRASFFRHIQKLEAKGMVKRVKEGNVVSYVLVTSVTESQPSQETVSKPPETNTSAPDTNPKSQ